MHIKWQKIAKKNNIKWTFAKSGRKCHPLYPWAYFLNRSVIDGQILSIDQVTDSPIIIYKRSKLIFNKFK